MNTTRVTFGMLNVALASVLVANVYLFKMHGSRTKTVHLPSKEKLSDFKMFTPLVHFDKINTALPEEEKPAPDLFKKQGNIITFNTNPTPGVVFRVQILESKTSVPLFSHEFNGIDNLKEEYADGLYKYTVGEFRTQLESESTVFKLKKKGYNDLLLVVYKDGKPIGLKGALASSK